MIVVSASMVLNTITVISGLAFLQPGGCRIAVHPWDDDLQKNNIRQVLQSVFLLTIFRLVHKSLAIALFVQTVFNFPLIG